MKIDAASLLCSFESYNSLSLIILVWKFVKLIFFTTLSDFGELGQHMNFLVIQACCSYLDQTGCVF